jgi:hypothetical protein
MNFEEANNYAYHAASSEFGSDVKERFFNRWVSSSLGHFRYAIMYINQLAEFFEKQNLSSRDENGELIQEMNAYIRMIVDGNPEKNFIGLKVNLHRFFWNMEFRRDPDKKKAMALFLKHYLSYMMSHIEHISVERFLEIYEDIPLDAKYFDVKYVFGELIEVVEEYCK